MHTCSENVMFRPENTPGCDKAQLVELNMELSRRLQRHDMGSEAYDRIVRDFHTEIENRIKMLARLDRTSRPQVAA